MAFNFFRGQLAEVIQWAAPQSGVLLWKFPSQAIARCEGHHRRRFRGQEKSLD
ncbi:hypothetical protein [Hymenobacter psoromatis]|uniref:hypothetical protein n=1 Tax=Hymenobacter psoromatis TaxID=1484116 RepID=UPI001CBF18A7|nr:hypothetical protein [Hymenobacter psoromatis]